MTLLAVSTVGVFFTVPDTDVSLALVPIAALIALASWPLPLVRLGGGGAAAVGALAWVSAVGGVGRGTAVVGGLACLGLLAAEPLGAAAAGRREPAPRPGIGAGVSAALGQLAVVYVASRVAGVRVRPGEAAPIAAVDLLVAAAAVGIISRRSPRMSGRQVRCAKLRRPPRR